MGSEHLPDGSIPPEWRRSHGRPRANGSGATPAPSPVDVITWPGATAAVEQHQRTPVLLGVGALHLAEELTVSPGTARAAHMRYSVIALIPQR